VSSTSSLESTVVAIFYSHTKINKKPNYVLQQFKAIGKCIPHCIGGETDRKKSIKGHKEWGELTLKFRNYMSVFCLAPASPRQSLLTTFVHFMGPDERRYDNKHFDRKQP